jgi:hypothetical protein
MARPSLKTPKLVEEICERLSRGEPLARICDDPKMPSFNTVWRWEQEDDQFREISTRARETGTHYIADDCLRISDSPDLDPQDKRIRIDTRMRLIGKWNARKYGDKIDVTSAGEKVETDSVTAATRLAAIFADIEKRNAAD